MTAAQRFSEFASSLGYEDLPPDVVEAAKLHLLDTIGCGLAAHALGVATHCREVARELGGDPQASVIGAEPLPAANAALANGTLCHGLDFDDTHSASICHVGVVVGPAALAAGETHGASGRELATALVAGNEIVTRIGMAAPSAFHRKGFHPTAVCGVFGAAAAAARLSRLDRTETVNALGIAGSMASGIFEYLSDGSATKPIHAGWAAHGGILAARLAAHGATGPATVLEGRFGLYAAYVDLHEPDLELQLADLGTRWETRRIAYKAYPACHYMHGSLGAAAEAVATASPAAAEIEEIVVSVPPEGVPLVLEPVASKLTPRSDYEAKFSLQYSVAALIVHGRVDLTTYTDEAIRDPRVLELAGRVRYEAKPYETYPAAFPGGVRIRTRDGRIFEADHPYQLGGPENPMSADEVREKFRTNASLALDDRAVAALEETVLGLEEQDDLRAAFARLAADRVAA